jgi:hypothetical protein
VYETDGTDFMSKINCCEGNTAVVLCLVVINTYSDDLKISQDGHTIGTCSLFVPNTIQ